MHLMALYLLISSLLPRKSGTPDPRPSKRLFFPLAQLASFQAAHPTTPRNDGPAIAAIFMAELLNAILDAGDEIPGVEIPDSSNIHIVQSSYIMINVIYQQHPRGVYWWVLYAYLKTINNHPLDVAGIDFRMILDHHCTINHEELKNVTIKTS